MDKNPADLTAKLNDVPDQENQLDNKTPTPPTGQRIDRDGAVINVKRGKFLLNS